MIVVIERRRAIVCLAATLSCAGLALPVPAFADDDAAATVPTLPSAPDVAADDVLDGLLAGEADDVLDAAAAAVDAVRHDEQPSEAEAVPAAPAQEEGPSAAAADDTASEAAPEPDITPEAGDTTGDSTDHAAPAPTAPAPAAAASSPTESTRPAGALNLNVDVRVSSAGDNGAVTQSNATAASGAARANAAPAPSGAESTTAAPTTAAPTEPAASWYWEWDCLSQPSVPVVSTVGSGSASGPDSWIWIWNCGENTEQYHGGTDGQYQQINANISVRIASPGNNGPVTQTNIAISTGAGTGSGPSRPPSAPSAPSVPGAMQVTVGITVPAVAIVQAAVEEALPAPAQVSGVPGIDEAIAAVGGEAAIAVAVGSAPRVLDGADEPAPVQLRPVPLRGPALAPASGELRLPPLPGTAARIAPRWAAGGRPTLRSADAPGRAASEGRTTGRAKRTPGERAPAPPAPPPAPTGVTASAAGAAGSPGGGIPIFLALPFVAAMLDLARRVALDRATWPSGHRRRVPDRPG